MAKRRANRADAAWHTKERKRSADYRRKRYNTDPVFRAGVIESLKRSHRKNGRRGYLRRNYGLTLEAFDAMFRAQGKRCAICRTRKPTGKGWCVDHCHKRGHIRGILCSTCNRGIGNLRDNPENCRRAAQYLDEKAHP